MSPALAIATIGGLAFAGIGTLAILLPRTLSRNYGLPVADEGPHARGFVRAGGVRDIAFGALLLAAVHRNDVDALIALAVAGIAIACADALIVARSATYRSAIALATHALGAMAFSVLLALLL